MRAVRIFRARYFQTFLTSNISAVVHLKGELSVRQWLTGGMVEED